MTPKSHTRRFDHINFQFDHGLNRGLNKDSQAGPVCPMHFENVLKRKANTQCLDKFASQPRFLHSSF
jgi:hypothetical protein